MDSGTIFTSKMLDGLVDLYNKNPIQSLALAINEGAADGVHGFEEYLQEFFTNKNDLVNARVEIYSEFICFYTSLMFRHLDAELGEEQGAEAMHKIAKPILNTAAKKVTKYGSKINEKEAEDNLYKKLNAAEKVYVQTTSFAGKDTYDETSTVFQFKKRIFAIFGGDTDMMKHLKVDVAVSKSYISFMTMFKFNEWVKGPIAQLGYKGYDSVNLFE